MLARGAEKNCPIGAADLSTAFINADLDGNGDGIYLIAPPKSLVAVGLEEEFAVCKLSNALCGLKRAPKKWEIARHNRLKEIQFGKKGDGRY